MSRGQDDSANMRRRITSDNLCDATPLEDVEALEADFHDNRDNRIPAQSTSCGCRRLVSVPQEADGPPVSIQDRIELDEASGEEVVQGRVPCPELSQPRRNLTGVSQGFDTETISHVEDEDWQSKVGHEESVRRQ